MEIDVGESDTEGAGGASGDADLPEVPNAKRRFLPSSIGLTVLLPQDVTEIQAVVSWGDYRTEPPLPESVLLPDDDFTASDPKAPKRPKVDWVRAPQQQTVRVPVPDGRGQQIVVPESAAMQRKGGGLVLEAHARLFTYETPDGSEQVRAVTVFLVNRRAAVHRRYADVSFVFQAKLELVCEQGFRPRRDLSGFNADDPDLRVADLHYRDVCEYGVGRNVAAAWNAEEEKAGCVARVWTDPLPQAEVERVAPNEDIALKSRVAFDMARLAEAAAADGADLVKALSALPQLYAEWIDAEGRKLAGLASRRRETAEQLIADMRTARDRIAEGIDVLSREKLARAAFRFMNLAVPAAARRRDASQPNPDVAAVPAGLHPRQSRGSVGSNAQGPRDRRPAVLSDRRRQDRSLSRPRRIRHRASAAQGLGSARRRRCRDHALHLAPSDPRPAVARRGVVCALELMRTDAANVDEKGRRLLGDWPIEIGLWVGSDASPNRLGGTGDADQTTAVRARAPLQAGPGQAGAGAAQSVPMVRDAFHATVFACMPNDARRAIW